MKAILTGKQMRDADAYTIKKMGVPSLVLMERAALAVMEVLEEEKIDLTRSLIVCGSGNNGGDGLAIARLLHLKGYEPEVWYIGNTEHASEENKTQYQIAENYGISVRNTFVEKEYSVIIDAVFGTGLKREVEGHYREAIDTLNICNGTKVSIDIPSGVSDTTGNIWGTAFRADITVCLAYEKIGAVLYPGTEYAGRRIVKDIGIKANKISGAESVYTYEKKDLPGLLPKRRPDSNKGNFGKVLMITGCSGMAGASYLSAKAAYCAGAGLVQIYTDETNRIILQQLLPEAIITTYTEFDKIKLKELFDWADVISIGSGLGISETAEKILTYAMQYAKSPCVIDGDGLNILAEEMTLLEHKKNVILTPHMKEMSRLQQYSVQELKENGIQYLREFVEDYPVVCAMKDARTMVASDDGGIYINTTGNESMAKAGSGDVLAGIITGLLAQGLSRRNACETGVFLHGLCGDQAKKQKGSYSVLASDLIDALGEVLKGVENEDL